MKSYYDVSKMHTTTCGLKLWQQPLITKQLCPDFRDTTTQLQAVVNIQSLKHFDQTKGEPKAEIDKKTSWFHQITAWSSCVKCTGRKSKVAGLSVMVYHDIVFIGQINLGHLTHGRDLLHRLLKHQLKVLILKPEKHHTIKSVHQPNHINP